MSRDRIEEIIAASRLNDLIVKKEEEKVKNKVVCGLAIVGVVAAVAAIAYGVYCFLTPDYFEDEFEDEFEEDFFDCEDEI